jgi:hypothetical protein
MKKLITILVLFAAIQAEAQKLYPAENTGYGQSWPRGAFPIALHIPVIQDTATVRDNSKWKDSAEVAIFQGELWYKLPREYWKKAGDNEGYLTAEEDPAFSASPVSGVTLGEIGNWNTAFAWGSHASAGYEDSAHAASTYATITSLNDYLLNSDADARYKAIGYIPTWSEVTGKPSFAGVAFSGDYNDLLNKPAFSTDASTLNSHPGSYYLDYSNFTNKPDLSTFLTATTGDARYSLSGHTHSFASLTAKPTTLAGYGITDAYPLTGNPAGYLQLESDPVFGASPANGITVTNINNWNTAFAKVNISTDYGALTTTQRDAIASPVAGSRVFNTTDGYWEYYNSFWGWMPISASNEWKRHYGAEYFRDFYSVNNDAYISISNANSGTAVGSQGPTGSTSESSGTMGLSMPTTTNARAFAISNSGTVVLGSGLTVYEARVYIPILSNSTDRYVFGAGFYDNAGGNDQTDAVYLLDDEGGASAGSTASPNWQIVTSSNSVRSFVPTSNVVTAAAWYVLRIEINATGTQATFFINGTNVGTATTNIPTGLARATGFGAFAQKVLGTTTRNVLVNYMSFKQKYSTPR